MSKVVHLSEPIHALAKQFCQQRRLRMNEWVGSLIADSCRAAGDVDGPSEAEPARPRTPSEALNEAEGGGPVPHPSASWLSETPA